MEFAGLDVYAMFYDVDENRYILLIDKGSEWVACYANYLSDTEWHAGSYFDNYPRAKAEWLRRVNKAQAW